MSIMFRPFWSSSMPKRLLRYALSRLELLDAEALDMENLDFALGRNTMLEFRDVGIKLEKLEKLLQLPATLKLQRAKVLLLRITVPMDFYTSPITVEVDGVDVRLRVPDADGNRPACRMPAPSSSQDASADVVPNTVDLAQSFLETQPSTERKRLEEALAAETQDLGASLSVSDDGSEDEPAFGTGQPLSLPEFLADFLQSLVDRIQVRIKRVGFHLDMDVPADASSSTFEPVSFEIAIQGIDIQGVTAATQHGHPLASPPPIMPKQGKRHVSLDDVRAYLVSEANAFPALTRSPSMASPSSLASSPTMTRSPPSRQSSSLSRGSFREQPMAALQEGFRERFSAREASPPSPPSAGDSEVALDIPYDLDDVGSDESPPTTPRASVFQQLNTMSEEEQPFYSTISPTLPYQEQQEGELPASDPDQGPSPLPVRGEGSKSKAGHDRLIVAPPEYSSSSEDLTESHLYTHEEAQSMYMSAFSSAEPPNSASASRLASSQQHPHEAVQQSPTSSSQPLETAPCGRRSVMPGTWGDESERFHSSQPDPLRAKGVEASPVSPGPASTSSPESGSSSPAFSRVVSTVPLHPGPPLVPEMAAHEGLLEQDDAATPKGPTRAAKEILHLRNVSVYIPSLHRHIQVRAPSSEPTATQPSQPLQPLATSVHPQAPGAFSVHGAAASASPDGSPPSVLPQTNIPAASNDNVLEVILSPLTVRFDASLGFLLAMVIDKLLKAVRRGYPIATADTTAPAEPRHRRTDPKVSPEIRVTAQEISLNFLNRLSGVADTPDRHLDPSTFSFDNGEEVLLNATLLNLVASMSPMETTTSLGPDDKKGDPAKQSAFVTKIDLQRFRFGYANGDIISFDSGRPMTTSVRDTFLCNGHDVAIKLVQSVGSLRADVETLPLVMQIDLQRLDETLGWFGGLSGFLNMSASTASGGCGNLSPNLKSAALPPASRKPRGVVHFQAPPPAFHHHPEDDGRPMAADPAQNKVNVRIGGALVELVGRDCISVAAETNAIKIVGRDEGMGAACSRIRVSGPYLKNSPADPAITAEVGGVRLELSTAPKDHDLEKLLELIIPSKVKFDDSSGEEIMVDTLLRQRRKGSVLRATVESANVRVSNPAQLMPTLTNLAEELAKISTVATKYLPEDDRPGLLTLATLRRLGVSVDSGSKIGHIECQIGDLEIGHITVPSLVAVTVRGISIRRNGTEDLVMSPIFDPPSQPCRPLSADSAGPVIIARIIGDEMEPTMKLKLRDLRIEYRVPTIMDLLGLDGTTAAQDLEASLTASIASLGDRAYAVFAGGQPPSPAAAEYAGRGIKKNTAALDAGLRDCLLGLNPLNLTSKMVVALTDARVRTVICPGDRNKTKVTMNINKASILLTDNVDTGPAASAGGAPMRTRRQCRRRPSASIASPQVAGLCDRGFVEICYVSSASVVATVKSGHDDGGDVNEVDIELRDDLLVLETCADSTQTLIALASALKPPTPPSREDKYRTQVVPVQDLLASISAEAFGKPEGEYDFDQDFAGAQELAGSGSDLDYGGNSSDHSLPVECPFFPGSRSGGEELFDATTTTQDTAEGVLLTGLTPSSQGGRGGDTPEHDSSDDLVIHEDFYSRIGAQESHTAKIWNSAKNTYDRAPDALVRRSPLKVSIRDVHVIWNLFDGYDWAQTRDVIAKAVEDVEAKAMERQQHQPSRLGGGGGGSGGPPAYEAEEEEEETIGDFLFNSIYIGVPLNRDPRDLTRAINEGLDDDNTTEMESIATTTTNRTMLRHHLQNHPPKSKPRRLRLNRSKHHKITFELRGVSMDLVAFPPPDASGSRETLSSIDVRVHAVDIFDHVPTSTWKKFATYDYDGGEREMGSSMVHIELLIVRPIPELAASEIVMRATVLPLRLHVDQDALDFITRFFEFKDEEGPMASAQPSTSDAPFLQRVEINDIPVKLDFKPRRVDYAGLRSGHTTEFMNFVVLEEARMVLRRAIVYGVSGFDRLGRTLNDIWMPDVRRNQLPSVVAGLAPVRSFVNIGSGFRDLVEIPVREYRRDGRVIRSISKGAAAFARTTGTELVKLGAKIAVGTQYALQGAEEMLTEGQPPPREAANGIWDEDEDEDGGGVDSQERKQISLYADQPMGVLQGLRGGYRSLTRDVSLARDAIIAVPGEVMESGTAGGAARAVWKRTPTIIFRPAVGVSKAIGQTLLGATNTIDPQNRRRVGEKYKH